MTDRGLVQRALEQLDRRLAAQIAAPVCIGLSGGGDSVALLLLAADWARARGRRLLALTVDHQLQPDSADWTRFAGSVARAVGADWQALAWDGARGGAGVSGRARQARHRLLAEAARAAGARVILLAHTADDVGEGDWMRARGSTLGQLRDWSPSPVWPQGRGLVLCRPLLGERRQVLRDFLKDRGQAWIDDPANDDDRYGRSRARTALAGELPVPSRMPEPGKVSRIMADEGAWAGVFEVDRQVSARSLAVALVCAGGGDQLPRGDRLAMLKDRLARGETLTASLAGARIEAEGKRVRLMREPGEFRRQQGLCPVLIPGQAMVWDGRFEIGVDEAGWQVVPAQGRIGRLERTARALIAPLPPAARASLPVLENPKRDQVVLAGQRGWMRPLIAERLALALGEKTQEGDLFDPVHGETPVSALFSRKD
ncbi:tRNA lysidine(34) synthetase TilS [Brevundimonas vesicularis]|uniref:tRNA lysidine(34) synthetase TilS n=1 Tax=Brevundimonas vesicularis TaxID=41276 RepID=UPI0038D44A85